MRNRSLHLGWVLAALNVLAFSTLLGVRSPQYELLAAKDQQLLAGGGVDFSTADPIHLAGRPFFSSAHVPGVPFVEDLYFALNTPAMLAALWVAYPVASSVHEWWSGSVYTPFAWQSWALALSFGTAGLAWAFVVGVAIDWWRASRQEAGYQGHEPGGEPPSPK